MRPQLRSSYNLKILHSSIGRTARAGKTGMALSFVIPKELYRKHKPTSSPTAEHDEDVLAKNYQAPREERPYRPALPL